MATVLAVDLAAKYSAACLMRHDYTVLNQFDSWGCTEDAFIYTLVSPYMFGKGRIVPDVMVIEDLPHGLKYSTLIKSVCRLQGRIAQAMHETTDGDTTDILYAAPNAWRMHFEGLERGTGSAAVVPVAAGLGYTPPDLMVRAKGNGGKTRADKVATDYCSAYLIARWAVDMKRQHGTYDVVGTSRHDSVVIRKRDWNAKDC